MHTNKKFSILIPTRNRANTIESTILTCLKQDDVDLEIVICDNASTDSTNEVVERIKDTRVKYHYFSELLPMSLNWERGLSLISGSHLILIGSDDALIPNSLRVLEKIFSETDTEAVNWLRPNYNWPDILLKGHENLLHIPPLNTKNLVIQQDAKKKLQRVLSEMRDYSILPTLYNSAVSTNLIKQIQNESKSGIFFNCQIPDVYSGILIASNIGTYYSSSIPFSINGGSGNSNGVATFGIRNNNPILAEFKTLNSVGKLDYADIIPDIYCDSTVIGEAIMKANKDFPQMAFAEMIDIELLYTNVYEWIDKYLSPAEKPEAYEKLNFSITQYNATNRVQGLSIEQIKINYTKRLKPQQNIQNGSRRSFYQRLVNKLRSLIANRLKFDSIVLVAPEKIINIFQIAIILEDCYSDFYRYIANKSKPTQQPISRISYISLLSKFKRKLFERMPIGT